jgi:hypothetical protein
VESQKTYVAGIANVPLLPEISYDKYNANDDSNDSSDFSLAEVNATISLKPPEFSSMQFAKRMGSQIFVCSSSGR